MIQKGDCVALPDGRIGRVRDKTEEGYRIRVRRKTSKTHQFLIFPTKDLKLVACPAGWMSREGYNRYLKVTLQKMKLRNEKNTRNLLKKY